MARQECSACGQPDATVNRNMFDGMCANCTTRALYDDSLREQAVRRNEELKGVVT